MKKKLLIVFIGFFVCWNQSTGNSLKCTFSYLHFSVSKCTYGLKAHLDSIAFEIEKPLIKDFIIRKNSYTRRPMIKNYEAGDFKIQIWMNGRDPFSLNIRVIEKNKEIFLFEQRKSSSAKYIFYDTNSQPYLIETILMTGLNSGGAGISRPPIRIKKIQDFP